MFRYLTQYWLFFTAVIDLVVAIVMSAHVVLTKRDTRAAIAWVGLIWLAPLAGAFLYLWLGVNRIQRRARLLRCGRHYPGPALHQDTCPITMLDDTFGPNGAHLRSLVALTNEITQRPLLPVLTAPECD